MHRCLQFDQPIGGYTEIRARIVQGEAETLILSKPSFKASLQL